jgi:Potential Queuosine, Q, salvage protein family
MNLRRGCAEVAARAQHVTVEVGAIASYAERLEREEDVTAACEAPAATYDPEEACARVLTLDAINFGSGWFPTLKKRPGLSGYRTIAAGLSERFEAHGPWTAAQLQALQAGELAETLSQDPDHPLIALFIASLRDLGTHVEDGFTTAVGASAVEAVSTLATWQCFHDTSSYDELQLPFLKRAQLAAADLHRAGVADYSGDLHKLTIFADNLVPHVLALDGILALEPALKKKIANEEQLEHGSKLEVELRACAIHAAELLVAELRQRGHRITAAQLDAILWERGGRPFYKARPRPRCRCTAY